MLKKILIIFTAIVIVGCSSKPSNKTLDDNSDKKIAEMIIKGVTTKKEIVDKFGKAELVKRNTRNQDVWIYEDERTSLNPLNIIPFTKILLGQTGREKKLTIIFNGNIVEDYTLSNTDVRTRGGVFTSKTPDKDEDAAKAQKKAAKEASN